MLFSYVNLFGDMAGVAAIFIHYLSPLVRLCACMLFDDTSVHEVTLVVMDYCTTISQFQVGKKTNK